MTKTSKTISTEDKNEEVIFEGDFTYHGFAPAKKKKQQAVVQHSLQPEYFSKLSATEIAKRLWTSYKLIDANFEKKYTEAKDKDHEKEVRAAGTTASTTVYDGKGNLITATLGDTSSFAVIYGKAGEVLGVTRLNSITHIPSIPSEKKRITESGGDIYGDSTVNFSSYKSSGLKVTRGLGDYSDVYMSKKEKKKLISSDAKLDITNIPTFLASKGIKQGDVGSIQIISTSKSFTTYGENVYETQQERLRAQQEEFLMQELSKIGDGEPGRWTTNTIAEHLVGVVKTKEKGGVEVSVAVQNIALNKNNPVLIGLYDGHESESSPNEAANFAADFIGYYFMKQCDLNASAYAEQTLSTDNNPQSLDKEDEELLSFTIDGETPLEQLKQAISFAQAKYKIHFENNDIHARGKMGLFSTLRHGKDGQNKAEQFKNDAKSLDSLDDMIKHVDKLLTASNTRFHRHSFSSYLFDELSKVLIINQEVGITPNAGRHYDSKTTWSNAKTQFEHMKSQGKQEVDHNPNDSDDDDTDDEEYSGESIGQPS